jgi:hypothetical protein
MKFITSTLLSLSACGIAHAAPHSLDVLEGEYKLASSTTVPASSWGFSKARISIRKLDEHHVVILLACEWKRVAKAACDDYYFAQSRDGGIYIQDVNTDSMRLYFDPASRTLSMISRGVDAKSSVRRDLFTPTENPLDDATLARRMKRALANSLHKENIRVFGPYTKWKYENNRIEFQNVAPNNEE